jgi:hypothetical protein
MHPFFFFSFLFCVFGIGGQGSFTNSGGLWLPLFFFFFSLMLIGIVGPTIANRGGEALLSTIANKKESLDSIPFF